MMLLSDFETLEDAKLHTEVNGRMASPDIVISLLTQHDSVISLKLKAETDDKAAGFLLALSGSVTDFNVMTGHTVGDAQQLLLAYLVYIDAVTQAFKDAIIAYANPVTYPFLNATQAEFDDANDIGETLPLSANLGQHKVLVNITTKPNKLAIVKIQQRFGSDENNLTEWHDVGQISCLYTQRTYESGMIPVSPAAYRELRLVSLVTLGMSVA